MVCLVIATVAAADPFRNGSFEDGIVFPPDVHFIGLPAGSTEITGWTVVGPWLNAIDYMGDFWPASHGDCSLDLDGSPGPGGVEQAFDTVAGAQYIVTFDMAGNPAIQKVADKNPSMVKSLTVSVNTVAPQSAVFTFDATNRSIEDMGWTTMRWSFVADAARTTLRFMSNSVGNSYCGPTLDNVRVVPLPVAAVLCMLGLGAAGRKLRRFA